MTGRCQPKNSSQYGTNSPTQTNTAKLEKLDDQLRDMAASDPDQATAIFEALSHSRDLGAKEAVAIYVLYLFPVRPDQALELLLKVLNDEDPDIRSQALDTFDAVTCDPSLTSQAAQLTTRYEVSSQ